MRAHGFTLIELLVGLAIVAILAMLVTPTLSEFLGNTRIRNTAESIANGIRLAGVEAIKRNQNVEFVLDPSVGWTIRDPVGDAVVQSERIADANGAVRVTPQPAGASKLTYSALGQYVAPNPGDLSPAIRSIDVTGVGMARPHPLRVLADPALGVGVRVCDPKFALPDPIGCP